MSPESSESVSSPAAPAVVETRDLVRRFGEVTAVDHLNLVVRERSIFGLLGPNGAGKSTAIKMLITLLAPTSGTARVAGFDVERQPAEVRRRIGYVPQMLSADGSLTGYENLSLSARLYGLGRAERRRAIAEALELMGLTDVADRLVRHYSGGMIRRLEIAQSMLHRPSVLFLDEPTVGLDPVARHAVLEKLREVRDELDTTVLLTTHAMDEADLLCEEVAFLHQGRLAATGSPAALK
ncbi:MAG TPA: ATP-binding cassette domain-containing protein, partial [Thermoanaerobaculia bacterium]|nr:ATP-binding cassette domain-containing protein [Thermoanaerobaculia bacterium]